MLVRLTELFRRMLHRRDTLARMGDDEFAVLLSDHSIEAAVWTANALREAIQSHHVRWAGTTLSVTASVAIVPITPQQRDAGALLAMADAACHAAKDAGRNRVHVYSDADLRVANRFGDMQMANRIKIALAQDQFSLAVQRISPVRATAQPGEHIELLLRMHDEDGQEILPGRFLPAAERYNLASQIDLWVLRFALGWLHEHPDVLEKLQICAINLSGQSLGDEGVSRFLLSELQRLSFPASKLCFEITETAAINDFGNALRFMSSLRELGCRFSLDDFGSGMASFAYLKMLPVDFLKIDGVFVREVATDSTDLALVRSMNELGHVLGKQTIAEFVEDESTFSALRTVGVDYVQGYWVGRPAPLDSLR
jgi:EAL domain-containing protein (putative c-di-GMP-specific phosphodiesterase class I)